MSSKVIGGLCSVLAIIGSFAFLGAGIGIYNLDINRLIFSYPTSDGAPYIDFPAANFFGLFVQSYGGYNYPRFGIEAFSCESIANTYWRNASHKLASECIVEDSELTRDVNGDGIGGDSLGYTYPGAQKNITCPVHLAPGAEICTGPVGCPTSSENKYYADDYYVNRLIFLCHMQKSEALFAGTFFFVFFSGVLGLITIRNISSDHALKKHYAKLQANFITVSMVLLVYSIGIFYTRTPATQLADKVNCALISNSEYFAGNLVPETVCMVTNKTCDPNEFGGVYYPGDGSIGTCKYVNTEFIDVQCSKASENFKTTTAITDCEAVDCVTPSSLSTSPCCVYRRQCCGDNADCLADRATCRWANETVTGTDENEKAEPNTCYNKIQFEATKCNEVQEKAFRSKLRPSGTCFFPVLPTPLALETDGGFPYGEDASCKPDTRAMLITAALDRASKINDTNINRLTRADMESNLTDCVVQAFDVECGSQCLSPTNSITCGNAGNCTWIGGPNVCKPNPSVYPDSPTLEGTRPDIFCEKRYDPTNSSTLAQSRDLCIQSDACYWGKRGSRERCLAKSCYRAASGLYRGYSFGQDPPCLPVLYPTEFTNPNYVPPEVKVCTFPERGCNDTAEAYKCRDIRYSIESNFYWGVFNGNFNPGVAFAHIECSTVKPEDCADFNTESGEKCVLLKGGICTSIYIPCPTSTQFKNAVKTNADIIKQQQTENQLSLTTCLNNREGTFASPLIRDVYYCYVFFTLGVVLSFVGLISSLLVSSTVDDKSSGGASAKPESSTLAASSMPTAKEIPE